MRVLVACEVSGVVRDAFRRRGHDAWSCDVQPSRDMSHHFYTDVFNPFVWSQQWDLLIAHPPCTYLCSSGLHWNVRRPTRKYKTDDAARFFIQMVNLGTRIGAFAIENPIGCMSRLYRKPDQIVQPHQFGDDASKATCLWLHNVPALIPTSQVAPRIVAGKARWANQTDSGQNKLSPSEQRSALRAQTYLGIAEAMAAQWGR
jgi:hypothetical protein